MQIILVLCGPPGCGKSYYRTNHLPKWDVMSSDDYIQSQATKENRSYSEAFADHIGKANELFEERLKQANQIGYNYIVDRTNTTEQSRKRLMAQLSPTAKKVAIYFPAYQPIVLMEKIKWRVDLGGHDVPPDVVMDMHKAYKLPQKNEGFDTVISSSHFIDIMKVMDFK